MREGEPLGVAQTLVERQAVQERIYKRGYDAAISDVRDWAQGQDGPTIWALQRFLSDPSAGRQA